MDEIEELLKRGVENIPTPLLTTLIKYDSVRRLNSPARAQAVCRIFLYLM